MKILKSTTLMLVIIMLITSMYGLSVGLAFFMLYFGLKEFINAKKLYDEKKNKLSIMSIVVGIFVCICAIFSILSI